MASAGDEENDAVLSDVEEDDPVPVDFRSLPPEEVSVEKFREVLVELDRERKAREVAENSKSELQVSLNRLKAFAHDAIKKREESSRQRDEALREKEEALRSSEKLSAELTELIKLKDEVLKQRNELAGQADEALKAKDSSRSEIETAAQMLVTGIEKISGKVNNFKDFRTGGLPRSHKYTGLAAIAYGVIKRTNEIVEELLRQIDSITKSRNEVREQMEQRNYEIAIEVSQLEATIDELREDISKKTSHVESLEKSISEKEKEMSEKQILAENELSELKQLVGEYEAKFQNLESKMDLQRPLLIDQLNYVAKIHDQIYIAIKVVDANNSDQSNLSESLFLPQETDTEENMRACLAGMESIYELSQVLVEKTRSLQDEKSHQIKGLSESVSRLVKEKEHIGSLLRSALSRRMSSDLSSKTNELFRVAENGLKEAGIDYRFSDHLADGKGPATNDKGGALVSEEEEIYALAGALENIIKQSQLEIIELQHSVEELRAEASLLKEHVEAQAKELSVRKKWMEELEEKERVANENVEGLMMDIAAAEEEITRWKLAAQKEADVGKAVEQEYEAQLLAVRRELEEAKQAVTESEKKLKFKEETAMAAMAARDAAEKSLRLADLRATRLRDKVEELTHQLEELDTRETSRGQQRSRYVCWPWQWLGLDFSGFQRPDMQQQQQLQLNSNEMELSEPLL